MLQEWTIGPEFHDELRARLVAVLKAAGYRLEEQLAGLAGSQELGSWKASGPRGTLQVEAETYLGLRVIGSAELVAELRERYSGVHGAETLEELSREPGWSK